MTTVNMHDAKTNLSRLVAAIQSGREREVVIALNGRPAARLVPLAERRQPKWGLLEGKLVVPDDIDDVNPEIEALFYGSRD